MVWGVKGVRENSKVESVLFETGELYFLTVAGTEWKGPPIGCVLLLIAVRPKNQMSVNLIGFTI